MKEGYINCYFDRLMRNILVKEGSKGWEVTDLKRINEMIISEFEKLIGAFHGPEEHLIGNGPTQPHYNAGGSTLKNNVINTHIYYSK
jgi:hypothetical protein